jgi:hypothetical protein
LSTPRRGSGKRSSEPAPLFPGDATDLDKLRRYHAELGTFIAGVAADRSAADRLSRHVRRHLPLYALGAVFALVVVLIPTVNERNGTTGAASSISGGNNGTEVAAPSVVNGSTDSGAGAGKGGPVAIGAPGSAGGGTVPGGGTAPVAKVTVGTGTTIGGFACKPGVRQIPWSTYANPCVAKFTGYNGGKTYRGVDAKTIKIVIRKNAVDAGDATDAQNSAQKRATRAQAIALLNKYAGYFSKTIDLYGRKLVFSMFNSKVSNGVDEAQSKNQQGACADATDIADSQNAFGDIGYATSFIESQPFSECAKQHGIFVPFGASYFPEQYYQRWDPDVWHVYMECERIGRDVAEYLGKRLNDRNAKWAGSVAYQNQKRKFGIYVPDNPGYQRCLNITEQIFKSKYGGHVTSRFNYALDVSRFPEEAARAVVQFQADGVTSLVNACDTLSSRFLTISAANQKWYPEWVIIGVATQDTDGAARTFDQSEVDGHLFGMSQFGQIRMIEGPQGEAYRTWHTAFPKEAPPTGFGDAYYRIVLMYNMFQAAGPILTPENIAKGLRSLPDSGGSHGAFGTWSFRESHTAVVDSREIYWVGSVKGYDGNAGAYLETLGGRRFRSGQWPAGEPPVYPKK